MKFDLLHIYTSTLEPSLIGLTTTLIFLILIVFGPLSQISLRYLSVVNPFIKISDPVVQSVQ